VTVLDELLAYVRLDDADRARLVGLQPRLAPHFGAIAEEFYAAAFASPGAAAVFKGPAQVERLRVTLVDWMSTGLLGPYDAAFYDKRSRIGRRHVQIGLAQHYMFTAINVVRAGYLDRIATLYARDEALSVVRSVDKLFDIELALMLRHYQLDSEEKRAARERAMANDRIQALQTMTAGLAHEVRNPLNAAKLQLELLERRIRRAGEDPRLLEPSVLASHEIARLTALLDEFLAFARAPELHLSDHDLVALARHVIELEKPYADRAQVELALADAPAPVIATVDAGKLHQIVQNLVRNALEAAPPRGHVTIAVAAVDGAAHLRVSDDGPGISDDVRTRMFEPFFSTKHDGTGMGLSIVHSFVQLHGGSIDIATGPSGTKIDVTLPSKRARRP
jgi:signal transduction histidine kinase